MLMLRAEIDPVERRGDRLILLELDKTGDVGFGRMDIGFTGGERTPPFINFLLGHCLSAGSVPPSGRRCCGRVKLALRLFERGPGLVQLLVAAPARR